MYTRVADVTACLVWALVMTSQFAVTAPRRNHRSALLSLAALLHLGPRVSTVVRQHASFAVTTSSLQYTCYLCIVIVLLPSVLSTPRSGCVATLHCGQEV